MIASKRRLAHKVLKGVGAFAWGLTVLRAILACGYLQAPARVRGKFARHLLGRTAGFEFIGGLGFGVWGLGFRVRFRSLLRMSLACGASLQP